MLDSGALKRLDRFVQGQGHVNALHARDSIFGGGGRLTDLSREVGRSQVRTRGQHYGAFNGILQLAYIAWPAIGLQHVHRFLGNTQPGTVHLATVMRDEVMDVSGDIGTPFTEGREGDRHHIEPIVEILTEGATLHSLMQVAVSSSQNMYVNANVSDTTNTLELFVL